MDSSRGNIRGLRPARYAREAVARQATALLRDWLHQLAR